MTSLGAPEFWRLWRIQEKSQKGLEEARKRPEEARKRPEEARKRREEARKRPGKGQKRPGRGQEKARRGQESRLWRKTARNVMLYEQKMTFLGAIEFWRF